jgi:hypothetical protein
VTADVSRSFADRDKLFHTVVHQQGRLPTDAEENHSAELGDWGHDSEFVETITPLGTPNNGFKVFTLPGTNDRFGFEAGSYYLGGARVENAEALRYADQVSANWLTQDEPVVADSRILVWLEVEERVVTGVQDAELLEPALRGADGSGRTRLCWRVRQAPTTADGCDEALAEVLAPEVVEALDPLTGAIASLGTLTIGFDDTDVDLDLCKPAVEPGYLGNRNNCYRLKRTRPGHFVWGEDNAAQLYRVTVDDDLHTIRFLTEPRDEYLRPRVDQTVELLRGDVLLPNYERVAELDGRFFRVTGGYQDRKITVGPDVDPGWLDPVDDSPIDPTLPPDTKRHLYLRVWTGGGLAPDPDVPFTNGNARTLVGTGLTVTFNGATLPGDGWTVSARPDAPERMLPWALRDGMHAYGPRRHVATLAIVDLATGDVHDCRERFRPLHKVRTCCTVTVGPPGIHVGDVDSIDAALELVPVEGGTVCLLAGEHPANVRVVGRRDLRFTGCPGQTTWAFKDPDDPLVTIVDSFGVAFSDIAFRSGAAPAIVAGRSDPSDDDIEHGALAVQDCVFVAPAGCAVLARDLAGATLLRCRVLAGPFPRAIRLQDFESLPAVFLQGEGLVVERCEIRAQRERRLVPGQLALGGVQIGGGSVGVTIRDSVVEDGAGIGITLGSITFVKVNRQDFRADGEFVLMEAVGTHASTAGSVKNGWRDMVRGFRHVTGDAGCIGVEPVDPDPGGDGDTLEVPVSEGIVDDVEILHNRILGMGSSGIATYPLGLSPDGSIGDAVAVSSLLVADNLVADCLQFEVNVGDKLLRAFFPVGGIALAVALDCVFRGNEVMRNGSDFGGGTCGIGIVYGEDIRVTDNRIEENGRHDPERVVSGPNAGVHLTIVRAGIGRKGAGAMAGSDSAALSVHGNIVSQPAGRALRALALSPVMVNDNRLVGGNPSRLFAELPRALTHLTYARRLRTAEPDFDLSRVHLILDLLGGDVVSLVNLGIAPDLALITKSDDDDGINLAGTFAKVATPSNAVTHLPATDVEPGFRFGGATMFHDNQVSLHRPLPEGPPMTLSAIFIGSLDDVGFADNQFGIELDAQFAVIDALILGVTVRITSNRGQEACPTILSLASLAMVWNTAALNQTTNPIFAAGLVGSEVQLNLNA